jgi:ribosomal protein S6
MHGLAVLFIFMDSQETFAPESRIYELGYLMVPTIEEKDVATEVGALKEVIDATGAVTISEEFPKLIDLAYEMTRVISNKNEHFVTGYFGWVKFEVDPSNVASIDLTLKRNEKLIRYILVKTVRENTLSPKKNFSRTETKKRGSRKDTEEGAVISNEEIDKQIDALVGDEVATVATEGVQE